MFLFTPIAAGLVNMLWELIFSNVHGWFAPPPELWKLPNGDAQACSIFTIGGTEQPTTINVVPSYWMTMMAFFFVYLFENAYKLYIKQQAEKAPSQAVMARKAQALISMIVIVVLYVSCYATQPHVRLDLAYFYQSFLEDIWHMDGTNLCEYAD